MRIKKGDHELEVSPDAYKSMYKRLKYEIVGKNKPLVKDEAKAEIKSEAKSEVKNENKNGNK